jgi:hypothetical protein
VFSKIKESSKSCSFTLKGYPLHLDYFLFDLFERDGKRRRDSRRTGVMVVTRVSAAVSIDRRTLLSGFYHGSNFPLMLTLMQMAMRDLNMISKYQPSANAAVIVLKKSIILLLMESLFNDLASQRSS